MKRKKQKKRRKEGVYADHGVFPGAPRMLTPGQDNEVCNALRQNPKATGATGGGP